MRILDARYLRRAGAVMGTCEPQGAAVEELCEHDHRHRKLIVKNKGTGYALTPDP